MLFTANAVVKRCRYQAQMLSDNMVLACAAIPSYENSFDRDITLCYTFLNWVSNVQAQQAEPNRPIRYKGKG